MIAPDKLEEEFAEAIYDFLEERFPGGALPGGTQIFADDHLDAEFKHEAGCDALAERLAVIARKREEALHEQLAETQMLASKWMEATEERNVKMTTTETGIVEPKAWVDESGTLRAPEGYAFESVDLPGFDASGYPRKGVRLVPLIGFTPPHSAIAAMPDSTQLLQTMAGALEQIESGAKLGSELFKARIEERKDRLTWYAVNVLQHNLDACQGTAETALAQFRAQERRS